MNPAHATLQVRAGHGRCRVCDRLCYGRACRCGGQPHDMYSVYFGRRDGRRLSRNISRCASLEEAEQVLAAVRACETVREAIELLEARAQPALPPRTPGQRSLPVLPGDARPVAADAYPPPERRELCGLYDDCLAHAVAGNWPSMSCAACPRAANVPTERTALEHQALYGGTAERWVW